jgi:hypothetical protein
VRIDPNSSTISNTLNDSIDNRQLVAIAASLAPA